MSKLIELFFSDDEKDREVFKKDFEQVLSEIPNKVANKENFWIYFFLGSMLTLTYTDLAGNLGVVQVFINKSNNHETMHLNIRIGDRTTYRSIRIGNDETSENEFKFQVQRKEKTVSLIIEYEERKYDYSSSDIVLDHSLNQIPQLSELNLSNKDEREVQKLIEGVFQNLVGIYNVYKEALQLQDIEEALHQALMYGFFKMNTEYDCFTEFNAGLGTADLALKLNNDVAIVVECKADSSTTEKAIEQARNRGYFYLDILGKFKSIFLVGINFNELKDGVTKVKSQEVPKPEGLINVLMDDEIGEDELEGSIQKELEFLCYTKNIGICNPDNPSNHNEADPQNKHVGSFTALVLGQILQYCSKNQQCDSEYVIAKINETQTQITEFTISNSDSELKLSITEFADKSGNTSPEHNECSSEEEGSPKRKNEEGKYNIKVIVIKDGKKSIYKIKFPDKNSSKIEIVVEQGNSYVPRTRYASGRNVKNNFNNDYIDSGHIGFSSTDSKPSSQESVKTIPENEGIKEIRGINLEELIEEIINGKKGYLQQILEDFKDFISSESNLQLLLKGIFMNAEINGGRVVAKIEFSAGKAGNIDLLVKLSNGQVVVFECKFCEEREEIDSKKEEAWDQLKNYTNKGTLKHILNQELHKVVVVFCSEGSEYIVEVESFQISENSLNDSGFVSCEDLSGENLSKISITPRTSLSSTPSPSPGIKRKVLSP